MTLAIFEVPLGCFWSELWQLDAKTQKTSIGEGFASVWCRELPQQKNEVFEVVYTAFLLLRVALASPRRRDTTCHSLPITAIRGSSVPLGEDGGLLA